VTGRGVVGLVVAVVVGGAVAAGLVMMGSPSEARLRRLDARRVGDLAQIARHVDLFWARRGALPASLDDLAGELGLGRLPVDPETGGPYGYRPLEANRYEICAEFSTESQGEPLAAQARFWVHAAGLVCFAVAAETPEREPGRPAGQPGRPPGR